jgi:hypothetical protein
MTTRTIHADGRDDLETKTTEFVDDRGYSLVGYDGDTAVLKKRSLGSWKLHLILLIFTVALGNPVYAAYAYLTGEKVRIELDD